VELFCRAAGGRKTYISSLAQIWIGSLGAYTDGEMGNLPGGTQKPSQALADYARILDKYYLPTRCPNGFDAGAPTDFDTLGEAKQAIQMAEAVLDFCRDQIDRTG
jgi:hypothetical protein